MQHLSGIVITNLICLMIKFICYVPLYKNVLKYAVPWAGMYIISMNRSRNRKDVYYLNQIWRIPLESEDPNPGIDKNTIVYKENNDTTVLRMRGMYIL